MLDTTEEPRKRPSRKYKKIVKQSLDQLLASRLKKGDKTGNIKIRKCLKCREKFVSEGNHNRMCMRHARGNGLNEGW